MAARIVSWSGDEHRNIVVPNLSKTSSVMSFDSTLSDKPEASLGDQGGPHMAATTESQPTQRTSKVIDPNVTRISTSTTIYPETDAADHDA